MARRTFLPMVMAGVVAAGGALAQGAPDPEAEAAIALCGQTGDRDARIACLEAVLRGETPGLDDGADAGRRSGLRLPFLGGGANESESAGAGIVPSDAPEAQSFGAEQLASAAPAEDRPAPSRLAANVVAASELPRAQLQVELDNGQVWRQTAGELRWDPLRHADPKRVEIWKSGFGGYRMRLVDYELVLRVERVR